jgi:hypothetical protein
MTKDPQKIANVSSAKSCFGSFSLAQFFGF